MEKKLRCQKCRMLYQIKNAPKNCSSPQCEGQLELVEFVAFFAKKKATSKGKKSDWDKRLQRQARQSDEYQGWRIAVFTRDQLTCQLCGQEGGELSAHHIKPWATHPSHRYEVSNGQTLCYVCHKKLHV